MRFLRSLLLCILVIAVIGLTTSSANAQWWLNSTFGLTSVLAPGVPTSIPFTTSLSALMTAPVPGIAPGIGGGALTAIMTAPVPGVTPGVTGFTAPTALMTAPVPSFAPGISGGGIGLWPTALMLATAPVPTIGSTFPALMTAPLTAPVPGIGGGGLTALMVAPTIIGGGGGIGLWPTAIMLPSAPTLVGGALWPAVMPPII